jgi:hypothetical protein
MLLATGHQDGLEAPAHGVNTGPQSPGLRSASASKACRDGVISRFNGLLMPEITHTLHTHGQNISMSGARRNSETQSGVDVLRF